MGGGGNEYWLERHRNVDPHKRFESGDDEDVTWYEAGCGPGCTKVTWYEIGVVGGTGNGAGDGGGFFGSLGDGLAVAGDVGGALVKNILPGPGTGIAEVDNNAIIFHSFLYYSSIHLCAVAAAGGGVPIIYVGPQLAIGGTAAGYGLYRVAWYYYRQRAVDGRKRF